MYSLKGFINIGVFTDNAVGVVAPLGELSTRSRTYSREIGGYTHQDHPGIKLITFSSRRSGVGMVPVNSTFSTHALKIAHWLYTESVAGAIADDPNAMLVALTGVFGDEVGNLSCGEMVHDGRHWLPEYLTWTFTQGGEENQIKLWFSDGAFQRQYDEYEILIVPPMEPLDNFFQDYNTVSELLKDDQCSLPALMEKVALITNGEPYTYLRTMTFDWHEPYDPAKTLSTSWTIVIYGRAGDTVDNIKQALTEYVLDNSNRGREEWVKIFPELFRVTEVIIAPFWNQYSIPNQTLVTGIYSPVVRVKDVVTTALPYCIGYDAGHVANILSYTNFVYKSLGLAIVPGPENRDGTQTFKELFPDYMTVPTTSLDFNRMSPRTQNWILLIYEMLKHAEKATEFSDLPLTLSRLKRENILYVTASYDGVNYLVAAKTNQV